MREPTGKVQISNSEEALRLVGQAIGPSDWVEVTQENVDSFARSVHDWHWAHNDPERASRGPLGGAIAHAHLTLSTIPYLRMSLVGFTSGECMFYGYNRVRFPTAVPVGARIRLHGTVVAVDEIDGGEELTLDIWVEIDGHQRPGCVAQAIWRHYYMTPPD